MWAAFHDSRSSCACESGDIIKQPDKFAGVVDWISGKGAANMGEEDGSGFVNVAGETQPHWTGRGYDFHFCGGLFWVADSGGWVLGTRFEG